MIEKKIIQHITDLKRPGLLAVFLIFLNVLFILLQAGSLANAVDRAVFQQAVTEALLLPATVFLLASLLRAVTGYLEHILSGRTAEKLENNLRELLRQHISQTGPVHLRRHQTGHIQHLLHGSVDAVGEYLRSYLPQLLYAAILPLTLIIFIFPLDWISALLLLLTAPLIPFFMVLIGRLSESLTRRQFQNMSRLQALFLDLVRGMLTIKIFQRVEHFTGKISAATRAYRKITMRVLRVAFLSSFALEFIATISTAVVAVEVGLRLLYDQIGFEKAFFILLLAPEFYQPLRRLGLRFHASIAGARAATEIDSFLAGTADPLRLLPEDTATGSFNGFSLENISYIYPGSATPALSEINLHLPTGQITAIAGPPGSGKSTLLSVLTGFIQPDTGKISCDTAETSPEKLAQLSSIIPQHPFIFNGTLRENITMGNREFTQSEIKTALQKAHLLDFVADLPDGLNSGCGENGILFSGGQAQRIALARAFLHQRPVYIFDEPTENLDPETEALIQTTIRSLVPGHTVIIVAHRIGSISLADRVICLDQGKISQQCTGREFVTAYGENA
jgi:ATP-binding cassette subfamily C protein CydD